MPGFPASHERAHARTNTRTHTRTSVHISHRHTHTHTHTHSLTHTLTHSHSHSHSHSLTVSHTHTCTHAHAHTAAICARNASPTHSFAAPSLCPFCVFGATLNPVIRSLIPTNRLPFSAARAQVPVPLRCVPMRHRHEDGTLPCHTCAGTDCNPHRRVDWVAHLRPTSAPGLDPSVPTSAPGLGAPPPAHHIERAHRALV